MLKKVPKKAFGRRSKKHGRQARLQQEKGILAKPPTKTQLESRKNKKLQKK